MLCEKRFAVSHNKIGIFGEDSRALIYSEFCGFTKYLKMPILVAPAVQLGALPPTPRKGSSPLTSPKGETPFGNPFCCYFGFVINYATVNNDLQ